MALAHDSEGFLTGPKEEIDTAAYAKHIALLREIRADGASVRDDISAIRKALIKSGQAPAVPNGPRRSERAKSAGDRAAIALERMTRPNAPLVSPRSSSSSRLNPGGGPVRGPDGRFGSGAPRKPKETEAEEAKKDKDREDDRKSSTALSDAASDLKRTAGEMLSGASQVDPTLAAAKEVKDMLAPVGSVFKPLGRLFGRKGSGSDAEKASDRTTSKTVPWYRRLWNELRTLNKKSGKGGGMLGGLLGGLATLAGLIVRMSGLGLLAKLLGGLLRGGGGGGLGGLGGGRGRNRRGRAGGLGGRSSSSGGGRGGVLGKAGGFLGKAGGFLGKAGKGLLRRLPLIGALAAGGSALYSMFGGGDQTKKERFEGAGSGIGSLIGGAIGMLGGPLGVIAGAAIGDIVGEKVGAWLSTVDWSAVGDKISDYWKVASDWAKDAFTTSMTFLQDSWQKVADLGTKVFGAVGDWFGEKLGKAKELAASAVSAVKETTAKIVDKAKDASNYLYDKGVQVVADVKDTAKNLATTVTRGAYSGGSNANKDALIKEMNAQGITDPNEQAMFMSQMDHESGGFKTYEENLNYSAKGLRKTFGKYYTNDADAAADARNPEAIANRVYGNRMGNTDAGDGYKYRGRGATQLTGKDNYRRAGAALGLDLVNNPELAKDPANAAKIAAWYWKDRKLGEAGRAGDVEAATRKINGGTNGLADRKTKYAEYLAQAGGGGLTTQTGDQSKAVPPPMVSRAIANASSIPPMAAVASPGAAAKPISYAPTAPDLMRYAPKAAPTVQTPLASSAKGSGTAQRAEPPLSQNLSDRQLAAVATGGIGMQQMRT